MRVPTRKAGSRKVSSVERSDGPPSDVIDAASAERAAFRAPSARRTVDNP
ncbi:hypothetical protein SAMN04488548_134140 [Gordonia westfalica]|uniref:Uncharacterized protein n=1 Tax=Gordonia westfalica TaxID=158898 RepID=A0A1H2GW16_9ACTN|nr:hypothetical protein SAMN04488548_134140 [Gordonia westfalica]